MSRVTQFIDLLYTFVQSSPALRHCQEAVMHVRKPAPARVLLLVLAALAVVLASLAGTPAARAVAAAPPAARAALAAAAGHAAITPGHGTRILSVSARTSDDAVIVTAKIMVARDAAGLARSRAMAAPLTVTVRPGNSLSGIAQAACTQAQDWTGLYAANRGMIGSNPNVIEPGQVLTISCRFLPGLLGLAVPAQASPSSGGTGNHDPPAASSGGRTWGITYGDPNYCGDGDGDGWDVNCTARQAAPAQSSDPAPAQQPASSGSYGNVSASSYSGFQACVIARESGGNSQVMNATGHYGLYQFSSSTWQAYGGSAGSFGHASVAEQNQVFGNAMAQGGQSNWSQYDGC
jgi:LysM repeat protein